jgi:hypothetical protein
MPYGWNPRSSEIVQSWTDRHALASGESLSKERIETVVSGRGCFQSLVDRLS